MRKKGIFILGSTGPTGELVTPALIEAGYDVSVMHRSDARRSQYEAFGATVLAGDAMDRDSMFTATRQAAQRCGVVLNLLGGNPFAEPTSWPDYQGTVNAVDAAIDAGFNAMILVTSIGTGLSSQWVPETSFLTPLLELKTRAEEYLQASALNGVILKPGGLGPPDHNSKPAGKVLMTENHGVRGLLPREDLAMSILEVIKQLSPAHFGKELYVVAEKIEHHAGIPSEYLLGGS